MKVEPSELPDIWHTSRCTVDTLRDPARSGAAMKPGAAIALAIALAERELRPASTATCGIDSNKSSIIVSRDIEL